MELSQEEIELFKKQIIQQIENSFSEEKKGPAIEKIKSMNDIEFIEFLKRNKLLKSEGEYSNNEEGSEFSQNSNPFRMIIEKKIPSYIIEENKLAIAVLEIKPISKSHIIIIPKKPLSDLKEIPKQIISFANKISKDIKKKFNPKEVLISPSHILGEIIINILPVYSNESIDSPRNPISPEELEELKNILEKKAAIKKEKKPKVVKINKVEESKIWFPKRIP